MGRFLVEGELRQLATDVRGFAWHDHEPAMLAWTERDADETVSLFSIDLADREPRIASHVTHFDGKLKRWGDWGFAISIPGRHHRFQLLGPDGGVGTGAFGYAAGALSSGALVVTDSSDPDGRQPQSIPRPEPAPSSRGCGTVSSRDRSRSPREETSWPPRSTWVVS